MPLIHFLLVYDRRQQKLVVQRPFSDSGEAVSAYEQMEQKHRDDSNMEIVLIGADSIETVMLTHGNYFRRGSQRFAVPSRRLTVTAAEERELLSPQQVAARLGFSREHVVRLINAGGIKAERMAGSSYWQIPLSAVLAFEERMAEADRSAAEWSRSLDELGAPLE